MSKTPPLLNESAGSSSGGGSFDIFEIVLYGLGRFRWWLPVFVGVGLLIGVGMSLMQPNTFNSSGELYVGLGMRESISPESVIGGAGSHFSLGDELHVLKSPELFEKVARAIGPDRILEPYDATRFDDEDTPTWKRKLHELQEWYFNRDAPKGAIDPKSQNYIEIAGFALAAATSMKGGGLSQIVTISARAKSAELAHDIVETTLEACRERHREIFADQFNKAFVEEQLAKATDEIRQVSDEFLKHRQSCGFYDITMQKNQTLDQLQGIEKGMIESSLNLAEIKADRERTQEKLGILPLKINQLTEPPYEPNPTYEKYTSDLLSLVAKKNTLSTKYVGDELKRQMAAVETEEAHLAEFLKTVPPMIKRGDPFTLEVDNPDYKTAERHLDDLDTQQERLLVNQEKSAEHKEATLRRLDALLVCEPIHRDMQERIGTLMAQINQFNSTSNKAEALALVDQDIKMSNLRILDHASFSPKKVAPQRAKSVLMGLAGGGGAWGAFALLRQLLDSKVRFPKNLERSLGVKVLGVVPEQKRWKRLGKRLRAKLVA